MYTGAELLVAAGISRWKAIRQALFDFERFSRLAPSHETPSQLEERFRI